MSPVSTTGSEKKGVIVALSMYFIDFNLYVDHLCITYIDVLLKVTLNKEIVLLIREVKSYKTVEY